MLDSRKERLSIQVTLKESLGKQVKRKVLYTPLKYLFTPYLLSKPQNILFLPYSNTLLSQRTLHLISKVFLHPIPPKPILRKVPQNSSSANPRTPNNNKSGDSTQDHKYQVSLLLYLICCIYSCIFIVKYGFIVDFFF